MDEDFYPPEDGAETPARDEGQTSLLPKALFGGEIKPGDTVSLRVVRIHGDQVEVGKAEAAKEPPERGEGMGRGMGMMGGDEMSELEAM